MNIPAARRTLSAFASNRREALTRLSNEVCSAVADGLNQLLNSEMSLFLGHSGQAGLFREASEQWLTRPLEERCWALYVDGTNFKIQRRGSTEREPSLVVLGVTESNHRTILAIEPGHRDNVESWRSVFRSFKQRGLDAKSVRIGIMDGLPELEKLFVEEFPSSVTQRCWVHAKRNALAKTPARLREPFGLLLKKVMYAPSFSIGQQPPHSAQRGRRISSEAIKQT